MTNAAATGSVLVTWATASDAPELRRLLVSRDLERLGRLRRGDDVRRLVTSRALLRLTVGAWMGAAPDTVTVTATCRHCGEEHGKPLVSSDGLAPPPHASISHGGAIVVVALTDAGPVGVDVESRAAAQFARFDDVALHHAETSPDVGERTRTWVRKESVLKATGHGLMVDPRRLRITHPSEPPALVSWEGPDAPKSPVWMADVDLGPDHVAAVSVLADERPEVTVRQADPAAELRTATL